MKFPEIKEEIHRIAQINDPQKKLEEIRKLDYEIFRKPKIKSRTKRGNYYYFYEILKYNSRGREILGPRVGRILVPDYEKNHEIIEKLRKEGNIQELKKYLEQY